MRESFHTPTNMLPLSKNPIPPNIFFPSTFLRRASRCRMRSGLALVRCTGRTYPAAQGAERRLRQGGRAVRPTHEGAGQGAGYTDRALNLAKPQTAGDAPLYRPGDRLWMFTSG